VEDNAVQLYLIFNFVLVIFGCFLPWIHSAIFVVRLNGIEMVDGQVVFAVSLFALFLLFYRWIRKQTPLWGVYNALGLIVIAVSALDLYQFTMNRYPIGPGIYLSLLGGIQVFGGSLYSMVSSGSAPSPFPKDPDVSN
jgi:uncharacterized membrane protein YgdD (TMEM256/DUF423 family)